MGKLVDIDGLNRQTSLMKDWVKNASGKLNAPVDSSDGNGKFLKSNGNGTTSWANAAEIPQADLADAVDNYFTEHPGEKIGLDTGDVEWEHLDAAVQNKITSAHTNVATVEASSTASVKHEKGSHFEYNNTLYEATTTIIAGETITPGTNCKAVVISDELSNLKSAITNDVFKATKIIAASDFNDYKTNGAYLVNSGSLSNKPDTTEQGTLLVFAYNTTENYGYTQIYITNSSWRMFYRAYVGGAWKEWKEVTRKNDLTDFSETVFKQGSTASSNFNNYVENGAYFVNSTMTNAPYNSNGLLCVFTNDKSSAYGTTQIFIPENSNEIPVYRYKWNGSWSNWAELYVGAQTIDFPSNKNVLAPSNFTSSGFISSTDGTTFTSNSNYMCTNDFIDIPFGTQDIYAVLPQTENNDRICCFLYYDSHGNYTGSYSGRMNGANYKSATLSGTIDVAKIKFWINKTTVSGGSNDVAISFSTVQTFPIYAGVKKVANSAHETPDIYMPFIGKTIVNFGDSIFGNKRDPFSVSDKLSEITGANVYNMGFGGTDMAARSSSDWDAFSMYRLAYAIAHNDFDVQDAVDIDHVTGMPSYFKTSLAMLKTIDFDNVDIITIAYGTNDFTGNIVIDNPNDDDDTSTFCGALRYSLQQIITAYPHIKIFVCGQTYRFWMSTGNVFEDDSDTHENGNNKKLTDFVAATKAVADEYHVPFIDNYYSLGINYYNRGYYFPENDGTHHNYLGAALIAEHIKQNLF